MYYCGFYLVFLREISAGFGTPDLRIFSAKFCSVCRA